MREYQEIVDQAGMDELVASIHGFHDSMTKEIHLVNRSYVLPDHSMVMGTRLDARVLIQSQWPPYALELLFLEIEKITMAGHGEYWGATGIVGTTAKGIEKQTVEMSFDSGALKITAGRLFSRVRSDWLGQQTRFGDEVPLPEAIPATSVKGNWRMCSGCCNAWEEIRFDCFQSVPSAIA